MALPWLLRYLDLYTKINTIFLIRVLLIFSISYYESGYFSLSHKSLSIINSNKQMAERIPMELQVVFPTEFENIPKT